MAEKSDELLRPLTESWLGVIEECARAKKSFSEVATMCRSFYGGLTGFMWKPEFRGKYFAAIAANPKFAVTINKAFELVAIFGPYLFWKYPHRSVSQYDPLPVYPDLFGSSENPFVQQMFGQLQQQMAATGREGVMRNAVMERYLNYSMREQPGGGLALHSQLAIADGLVSGRGCLWTTDYKFPGSDVTLVKSEFDPVSNLLIDPDCTDPTLTNAQFIVRKHTNSTWQLEDRFKLPKGSLLGKGQYESGKSQGGDRSPNKRGRQKQKETFDILTWYEVFSKCGVGMRLKGTKKDPILERKFDEVIGDYAYLCVAKGVNYPLNVAPGKLRLSYDDEVQNMLDWPVPYWKDNRWPVNVLDFYYDSESCWPIGPLAPGLGELICINVLTSVAVSQTYENSRQIIAILGSVISEIEEALNSTRNPAIVKVSEGIQKSISDCVAFIQRPEINGDVWKTIEYLTVLFDKRTGLSELLYSMNPGDAQIRSAEDAKIRQSNASVRPDYMANQVAKWQTGVAETEKICAHWTVKAGDVRPTLGPVGALLWSRYIENEDPELIFREMRCQVEAGDHKKPNKERETANLMGMLGYVFPELSKHADATGDTEPSNNFLSMIGEATDQDTSGMHMGPRVPMPPDPQMVQMQQQQMQLEMEKLKADVQKAQVDAQSKMQDAALKQQQAEMDAQTQQRELEMQSVEGQQELQLDRAKAEQDIALEQLKTRNQMLLEGAKVRSQLELQRAQGEQQMQQQAETHQQQQKQGALEFVSNLTQSRMEHAQKMMQARQQAASMKNGKPKSNGKA